MSGRRCPKAGALDTQGFTLVEVLVVLAIITLVAAMGMQSIVTAMQMSRERHTEVEILAMVEVVKLYKSETEDCVPGIDETDFRDWLVSSNYFTEVDLNDGWGRSYLIQIACDLDQGNEYLVWTSVGMDGLRGNDDDVVYLFAPDGWDGWTSQGAFN